MRDYNERLLDILESIEHIEKYAARGREAFENDELIQTWIVHHLDSSSSTDNRRGRTCSS